MDDEPILLGCLFYFILFVFFLLVSCFIDNITCHKTAEKLNYSCEYNIWTGCVFTDKKGKKFLLEQLREVE